MCPGAPFLVPGVAAPLALRSADLMAACTAAVRPLARADRIVVIAAGRRPARFATGPMASRPADAPFGRSDLGPSTDGSRPAAATAVGPALLNRAFPDGIPVPVDLVEVGDDPDGTGLAVPRGVRDREALLVIADGAATHGDDAPGRRDDRAGPFDDALAAALSAGTPSDLAHACADRNLAGALLAVTDPLRALARLTQDDPPTAADLRFRGNPYGVGYFVASWRWTGR